MRPNTRSGGNQTPTQQPTKQAYGIPEAAELLGLSSEALRMRLKRRTIDGEKIGDRWVVYIETPEQDATEAPTTDQTPPERSTEQPTERDQTAVESAYRELIDAQRDEISYLRQELSEAIRQAAAERERADVLHREALNRIEALTARTEQPRAEDPPVAEPPVSDPTPPGREQAVTSVDLPTHQESWLSSALRKILRRS